MAHPSTSTNVNANKVPPTLNIPPTIAPSHSSASAAAAPGHPPGHSFLSSANEVKNMETSLLSLLQAFHSGDLSAFGKGHSLETMEAVRAKQEKLARLHFDLTSKSSGPGTGPGGDRDASQNWMSETDQTQLVSALRELSVEIEKLHDTSS